jgi:hypothetical protein
MSATLISVFFGAVESCLLPVRLYALGQRDRDSQLDLTGLGRISCQRCGNFSVDLRTGKALSGVDLERVIEVELSLGRLTRQKHNQTSRHAVLSEVFYGSTQIDARPDLPADTHPLGIHGPCGVHWPQDR